MALTDDGSVWMTGKYGGITRLGRNGVITEYTIGSDDCCGDIAWDIVKGPDGAVWFAAVEEVGRIDPSGRVKSFPIGGFGAARAITAAPGALWFASDAAPEEIVRLSTAGGMTAFPITGPRRAFATLGIAVGPDGAIWFTQLGFGDDPPDGIGRMTPEGEYTSWPLPQRRAAPLRITAGPDGALWFTEQDALAIGRITTSGEITEFPLRTGLSPYDIATGPDGALWFTADSCIGRMTTSGEVTTWPVEGAQRVRGIAAAPDGSFWLADDLASAVRHFVGTDSAPPSAPCTPPTITRSSGSTRATLIYRREDAFPNSDWFTDARVRIARGGNDLFSETVPPEGSPEYGVFGETSAFAVRDLDGDEEPEVMLELNWNGTHCCTWSRVYRYDKSAKTYVPVNHMWGNGSAAPKLQDLDTDGRPEFVSQDDRFAYSFGGYAGSVRPIRIWSYEQGKFRDVTRRYPDAVERDAAKVWRLYLEHRPKKDTSVYGILPAWAADLYMLGRGDEVERTLEHERRHGYLDCAPPDECYGEPRDSAAYLEALDSLLRETGYVGG